MSELVAEASKLKSGLLVAADALADRGLFDAGRIAEIRSGNGYVDLGTDCVALSGMFQQGWDAVGSKTAVPRAEVDRAGVVGTELLLALGARAASVTHETTMAGTPAQPAGGAVNGQSSSASPAPVTATSSDGVKSPVA